MVLKRRSTFATVLTLSGAVVTSLVIVFYFAYPAKYLAGTFRVRKSIQQSQEFYKRAFRIKPGDTLRDVWWALGSASDVVTVGEFISKSESHSPDLLMRPTPSLGEVDSSMRAIFPNGKIPDALTKREILSLAQENHTVSVEGVKMWILLFGVVDLPGPQKIDLNQEIRVDDKVFVYDDSRLRFLGRGCVWILLVRDDKVVANIGFRKPKHLGLENN